MGITSPHINLGQASGLLGTSHNRCQAVKALFNMLFLSHSLIVLEPGRSWVPTSGL